MRPVDLKSAEARRRCPAIAVAPCGALSAAGSSYRVAVAHRKPAQGRRSSDGAFASSTRAQAGQTALPRRAHTRR